jgi:cytochrome P450
MRKVCVVEVLSARQVRRIESIKQDEVARLLESVAEASAASPAATVDVGERLARLTNNVIARAAFGGECRQQEAYLRELARMSPLVGGFSLVDLFPSSRLVRWLSSAAGDVRRSHARVQRILGDIIRERQEKKPNNDSAAAAARDDEDLLDVLLRLHKEDALSFPLTPAIISAVIFVSDSGSYHH